MKLQLYICDSYYETPFKEVKWANAQISDSRLSVFLWLFKRMRKYAKKIYSTSVRLREPTQIRLQLHAQMFANVHDSVLCYLLFCRENEISRFTFM